ncbi:MAG: DUF5668 domain-containing protein [Bacteroidota bacterium]
MDRHAAPSTGHIVLGTGLILLGAYLVLRNAGLLPDAPVWRYWPLLLVIAGILRLASGGRPGERRSGFWLLFIGLWLQISIAGLFALDFSTSWPLLLVAWGISTIWKDVDRQTQNRGTP